MSTRPSAAGLAAEPEQIDVVEGLGIPALRFEILRRLREGPASVSNLMRATGLSRNGVRGHLRVLAAASLVRHEWLHLPNSARPVAHYSINAGAVAAGLDLIAEEVLA